MTPSDKIAAQTALNTGRATYSRLDQIRTPEDTAADLVELWGSVESAMRSMLGGSSLSGQSLVREVRQRGLISLDQANALVTFGDARARVDNVNYRPTLTDVGYARVGYNALTQALEQPLGQAPGQPSGSLGVPQGAFGVSPDTPPSYVSYAPGAVQAPGAGVQPGGAGPQAGSHVLTDAPARAGRKKLSVPVIVTAVVILLAIAGLAYFFVYRSNAYEREMTRAIGLMQSGQTEAARASFIRIIGKHSDKSEPHVFLSRIARNEGDLVTARRELVTAIELDKQNGLAYREMGMLFLAENNPELARRFLVRALEVDKTDLAAQGYLGCALIKLNRIDEGEKFLTRAGPGNWSSCAAAIPR